MKKSFPALALFALLPLALAQTPTLSHTTFQEKPGSMLAPATGALGVTPTGVTGKSVDASAAIQKTGPTGARFLELHQKFLERGKAGPIGVLMLGAEGGAYLAWHAVTEPPKDGGRRIRAWMRDWRTEVSATTVE